ncbi:MAG: hypothetical protein Kow0029_23910 [Candidatus Rifleibacteriota bacterium]
MNLFVKTHERSGFTVLLGFLFVMIVVFAGIFAQTSCLFMVINMQKKVLEQNNIKLEKTLLSLSAEKILPPSADN